MKSTVAPYETAAWCVRIECTNGTTIRLTTYPFNLTMSNAQVYETDSGYEATALQSTTGFSASAIDLAGFVGFAGITRDQIASGLFDNARVYIFKCNFFAPVEDYEPVTLGFFGKTTIDDDRYQVECMAMVDVLNQSVGRTYSPGCSHTFGDARCGKDLSLLDVAGSLTSVTSNRVFRDSSRGEAADYFVGGTIRFTSGDNADHKPLEIKAYAANGTITTHEPFYWTPQVGDSFVLIPGCRKRLSDCQAWSNVVNFGGFPHMSTSSAYTEYGGRQ